MSTPRRRVAPNPGSLLLSAAVLLTHCPSHPPPTYVVVWPHTIRVQAPARVPLKAELIDGNGKALDADFSWASDPPGQILLESPSGREIVAKVDLTGPAVVKVTATANEKSGTAILLINQVVSGSADVALKPVLPPPAPPPPPDPVEVLYLTVASGRETQCEVDRAGGAAGGRAELGTFVLDGTCRAEGFILAASVAPTIVAPMNWQNSQDILPPGGFYQPKSVRVHFWVPPPVDDPLVQQLIDAAPSKANEQFVMANALLWKNRTGVQLVWDGLDTWSPDPRGRCTSAEFIDWEIPAKPTDGVLNVFMVIESGSERNGVYCVSITPNDTPPPNLIASHHESILFNLSYSFTTTLAHEVGHALGLIFPDWGHPFAVPGVLTTNLMKRREELNPPERNHLSVGQVLQMHLSKESILNRPAAGILCPQDGSRGACPALGLDLYSSSPVTP